VEKVHPLGALRCEGRRRDANSHAAPAVINAIYKACGARIRDLPLNPAKILKELRRLSFNFPHSVPGGHVASIR
jgi:hypothetical protein